MSMNLTNVSSGFENIERDSQNIFRQVLNSFSRPGIAFDINPRVKSSASVTYSIGVSLLLALMETGSVLYTPGELIDSNLSNFLKFHTGCKLTTIANQAHYIWVQDPQCLPSLSSCALGSVEYPEKSSTLIIEVESFKSPTQLSANHTWHGPGIKEGIDLEIMGLNDSFWKERQEIRLLYPCGVDIIFCTATQIVALPRSTRVGE